MKKNKLLSILSPEKLVAELKELGSVIQVSKKYQISTATAYSAYKIANIDCFVNSRKTGELFTKEQLQKDYNELQSIRKIGEKYNISHETVRDYIHKYKLDYNPLVIHNCDHDFFSRENEESFYLAGFIAADGCVRKHIQSDNSYQLYIGLAAYERPFLTIIKEQLKAETPIREFEVIPSTSSIVKKTFSKVELCITSKKMFDDLSKFNIVPRKTHIYTFPEWIINHPLCHHFMRGYFDGDGSFYSALKEGRTIRQIYFNIVGTKLFCETYRLILEQNCASIIKNHKIREKIGCYSIEYGGNGVLSEIANFLYKDATIYLPRKHNIIKHLLK